MRPSLIGKEADRVAYRLARSAATILAIVTCLAASGCAGPIGRGWANFRSDKDVASAAADDSFPSAAEVGLASTESDP
jgi:hypothetical protein